MDQRDDHQCCPYDKHDIPDVKCAALDRLARYCRNCLFGCRNSHRTASKARLERCQKSNQQGEPHIVPHNRLLTVFQQSEQSNVYQRNDRHFRSTGEQLHNESFHACASLQLVDPVLKLVYFFIGQVVIIVKSLNKTSYPAAAETLAE